MTHYSRNSSIFYLNTSILRQLSISEHDHIRIPTPLFSSNWLAPHLPPLSVVTDRCLSSPTDLLPSLSFVHYDPARDEPKTASSVRFKLEEDY